MIKSTGTLCYSIGEPHKLIVEVDPGLVDLYRALVPPYVRLRRQRWPGHITVVREEVVPRLDRWGSRQGQEVEFEFDPIVACDDKYHWLNVRCPLLIEVRRELGLPDMSALSRPPDGSDCFHITLGNSKA